jgi:hypothetical protein
MALHRGPDGWVPFYRRKDGEFQAVASVPVKELPAMIPGMIEALSENGYVAVNTMYRPGYKDSPILPGYKSAKRSKNLVRWVNACLVDLDVGREGEEGPKGLTVGQAVGALIDAQDSGLIPPVSIYARSGRGLYAMWCLKAEDGNAQPGLKWAINTAERINKELAYRLEALASDRRAVDVARIIRIPGTKHSVTGSKTQYWIPAGPDGRGFTYTLKELTNSLDMPPPCLKRKPPAKAIKQAPSGAVATGKEGQRVLWRNRYNEALLIADAIGGIPKGRRRICLTLLGVFAYRSGMEAGEVAQAIRAMAKRCKPPYPSPGGEDMTVDELVDSVLSKTHGIRHKISNDWLGSQFMVDADIAQALGVKSLVPVDVARKIKTADREQAQAMLDARDTEALSILRRWLKDKAEYPTGQVLAAELTKAGYPVKYRTAYNTLNRLRKKYGLPSNPDKRGRPQKTG